MPRKTHIRTEQQILFILELLGKFTKTTDIINKVRKKYNVSAPRAYQVFAQARETLAEEKAKDRQYWRNHLYLTYQGLFDQANAITDLHKRTETQRKITNDIATLTGANQRDISIQTTNIFLGFPDLNSKMAEQFNIIDVTPKTDSIPDQSQTLIDHKKDVRQGENN